MNNLIYTASLVIIVLALSAVKKTPIKLEYDTSVEAATDVNNNCQSFHHSVYSTCETCI